MSPWFYVGLAFGTTYVVLGGYMLYLMRRRAQAQHALQAELQRVEG